MKIFISHKDSDSAEAVMIQRYLTKLGVEAYLDLLDSVTLSSGKELTDHIKLQLNRCSDIMIVISNATQYSWWVPFEIGMSAELDMPTSSYLSSSTELPSFLDYWPKLKSLSDVAKYVSVRNQVNLEMLSMDNHFNQKTLSERRKIETPAFYSRLKLKL